MYWDKRLITIVYTNNGRSGYAFVDFILVFPLTINFFVISIVRTRELKNIFFI
jgi:hypothetical protein